MINTTGRVFSSLQGILLTTFLSFLTYTNVSARVTFDSPPPIGATVTIAEDLAAGSDIYILQATDINGDVSVFTILTQNPSTPTFSIDDNSDSLIVPRQGLDAEIATQYNITFRVTAGQSTSVSGILTVHVTDVNDNDPILSNLPYTGEVWQNDPAATTVATITASDPDISNLPVTYSLVGAQTTFLANSFGVILLTDPAELTSLASSVVLQVQASDSGRTGTAAVTINIHADYCYVGVCQNGGTCTNAATHHECSCTPSFTGEYCSETIPPQQARTTGCPIETVLTAVFGGAIAGILFSGAIGIIVHRILSHRNVKEQTTFQLSSMTVSTEISTAPNQEPPCLAESVETDDYETLSRERSGQDPEYSVLQI